MALSLTKLTGRIAALGNNGKWVAVSPNMLYMATISNDAATTLQLWAIGAGGVFTKLQSVNVNSNACKCLEWLDNNYLMVSSTGPVYIRTYKLENNALVAQPLMSATAASSGGPNFPADDFAVSADGTRVVASCANASPRWLVYSHSAGVLTRVTNGIPTSNYGRSGIAMTADGLFVAGVTYNASSVYSINIYKWSGSAYVLQNVVQPAISTYANGAGFNGDNLVVSWGGPPYLSIYKLNRSTGALVAGSIDVLPTSNAFKFHWGGDYLAVGMINTPYFIWYQLVGDALQRQNVPTATAGLVTCTAWADDYLITTHNNSPYIMAYSLPPAPKGNIFATTENASGHIEGYTPIVGSIDTQTDSPVASFYGFIPPRGNINALASDAIASLSGLFRWAYGDVAATADDAGGSLRGFHDWTLGVNPYRDSKIFQLRLEADGFAPLILDPSNISVRSNLEGRQSSISATIPTIEDVDAIAARAGGNLIFAGGYVVQGEERFNDILTLPLTAARPDEGTNNKSITLTANGPSPAGYAKTVIATELEYRAVNGLKRQVRMPVDINLAAGDTLVTPEGSAWTVGGAVYAIDADGGESMTVTEA